MQRETAFATVGRKNNNRSPGSPAAARVIGSEVVGGSAVGRERPCAAEPVGANDDDAAAGCAATGLIVTIRIVTRARAASAAHGNAIDGCGKNRTALAAYAKICVPRVTTKASGATVGPAAAARILIVGCGIGVGTSGARVAGRSARHAAVSPRRAAGIVGIGFKESTHRIPPKEEFQRFLRLYWHRNRLRRRLLRCRLRERELDNQWKRRLRRLTAFPRHLGNLTRRRRELRRSDLKLPRYRGRAHRRLNHSMPERLEAVVALNDAVAYCGTTIT